MTNLLLIGSGGHASVLLETLLEQKANVIGYVSPMPNKNNKLYTGIDWFECDEDIFKFTTNEVKLVNGIGSMPNSTLRKDIFVKFKERGYSFQTIVSKNADIAQSVCLEEGVQVMRGAILQTGAKIGLNSIVNTGAIIDHDCRIGQNNHVAPGVVLCGNVHSRNNVHFGTGCTVIQSVTVNENVVIGAGASITKDIDKNTICYPARITRKVIKSNE